MTVPVSRRVQRVKPSPTLAVTARAAQPQGRGQGRHRPRRRRARLRHAGARLRRPGSTPSRAASRATPTSRASTELKDAIIAKFKRDNGISYERSQILVSSGAKQTIYNLCMALLDPGDEAIIPAPYWVSYPDMVLLADGIARHALRRPGTGLQDHAAAARRRHHAPRRGCCCSTAPAIRPAPPTRARNCARSGEVLLEHPRIVIGTDDMYEKIYWEPEPFCSLVTAVPELYPPHGHDQRRLQGLRHDRLAHRLLRRPEGAHHGDEHHPGPVDLQCLQHLAEGGAWPPSPATRPASAR